VRIVVFRGNIIERTAERNVQWPDGNTLLPPGTLETVLGPQLRHPDANVGY
jgi:hypothetical protein